MAVITNTVRWADNTDTLRKNLLSGIDSISAMKQAVDRTAQSLGGTGLLGAANRTAAAIQQLGGITKLTASEQERANALIDKAIDKYAALGVQAPSHLKALSASLTQAANSTKSMSDRLQEVSTKLQAVGSAARTIGIGMTAAITVPLVGAATASLKFSADFEASMAKLVSLAGVSQSELAGVKQHILDLAPAVGIGPQALAAAMTKVSSTVSDTKVAMSILDIAARGSAAGMGTALDVAGALTSVVNSYGSANITAARAGDILTQAIKEGGAEAKELAPTLANVTPLAAQMGISFAEVAANIATVTKLGVPASEAVTQLSSVMSALLKENSKGAAALKAVGMSYADIRAEIKDKGLLSAIGHVTDAFKGNEEGLSHVFGRIEALRNVMSVSGAQSETYAAVLDKITNSTGSLNGAFDKMRGTQTQTWAELSAAAQVAAIKFGDALAPALKSALDAMKPLLGVVIEVADWFGQLPQPVQTAAIAFGGIAATAGPALFILGQMATSIATLIPLLKTLAGTSLFTSMGAAAGGMTGIGAAAAIAVPAIAGAGIALYNFNQNMKALEAGSNAGQSLDGLNEKFSLTSKAVREAAAETPKLAHGLTLTIEGFKQVGSSAGAATKPLVALTDEENKAAKAAADHRAVLESVRITMGGYAGVLKALDAGLVTNIQHELQHGVAVEKIAKQYKIAPEYVKLLDDQLKALAKAFKEVEVSGIASFKSLDTFVVGLPPVIGVFAASWRNASYSVVGLGTALSGVYDKMPGVIVQFKSLDSAVVNIPKHLVDLGGAIKANLKGLPDLIASAFTGGGGLEGALKAEAVLLGKSFADTLATSIQNSLKKNGGTGSLSGSGYLAAGGLAAMAGIGVAASGGGAGKAIGGVASSGIAAGAGMLSAGGTLAASAALAASTAGIGLAALGAYYGLKKMFSLSPEYKARRDDQKKLIDLLGETASQAQITAGAFKDSYHTIAIVGRDAFLAVGYSASQADKQIQALLNTSDKNSKGYKEAAAQLERALALTKAHAADVAKGVGGIQSAFALAGKYIPIDLQNAIKSLLTMKGLTDDQKTSIKGMLDASKPAFTDLMAIADKYGISLANLGPKFQQSDLESKAKALYDDFKMLVDGGADVNGVLDDMADEIQQLVDDSLKFGTAIPENMRPLIESLIKSGKLLDANGKQITDISELKFEATPLDQGLKNLNDSIERLAKVLGNIPNLLNDINNTPLDPKPFEFTPGKGPLWQQWQDSLGTDSFHTGGMINASTARVLPFLPRAHSGLAVDERMIVAQTGEGILSRGGMDRLGGPAVLNRINAGDLSPAASMTQAELAATGTDGGHLSELRGMRADMRETAATQASMIVRFEDAIRRLPEMNAIAVKSARAKAGIGGRA